MLKLLRHPRTDPEWHRFARQLVSMHMTLLGWNYADLTQALAEIGVSEDEKNMRNRIGRGRFRATLLLQCLMAMGVEELHLPQVAPVLPGRRDGRTREGDTKDRARMRVGGSGRR